MSNDHSTGTWDWVDPGVFALIGSASFFAGVGRLTMSLAVIMMELSMDIQLLVPIMLSIIVAKVIADSLTHSLYHAQIELKCLPFLDHLPATQESLDLHTVKTLSHNQLIVWVRESETVERMIKIIKSCNHQKFAVVREIPDEDDTDDEMSALALLAKDVQSPDGESSSSSATPAEKCASTPRKRLRFIGSIRRDTIYLMLQRNDFTDSPIRDYDEQNPSLIPFSTLMRQQRFTRDYGYNWDPDTVIDNDPSVAKKYLNFAPYVDISAVTVLDTFSLDKAYTLFRSMGLRHLWVLNHHGEVVGVLTKKDLMGFSIQDAVTDVSLHGTRLHSHNSWKKK